MTFVLYHWAFCTIGTVLHPRTIGLSFKITHLSAFGFEQVER